MDQKKLVLTLVVVAGAIVLAAGSTASGGYRWVAYRKVDCGGGGFGGRPCNRNILVQPNPAACNSEAINLVAVCGDQLAPFPLPAGCHYFQCLSNGNISECLGLRALLNRSVFVCKRR